jgi:ABC-type antimicrobial peptide transport system permease subunit
MRRTFDDCMLYGTSPTDPLVIAVGILLVVLVAFGGAIVPARGAAKTSVAAVLRAS